MRYENRYEEAVALFIKVANLRDKLRDDAPDGEACAWMEEVVDLFDKALSESSVESWDGEE